MTDILLGAACVIAGAILGYIFRSGIGTELSLIHGKLTALETAIKAKL